MGNQIDPPSGYYDGGNDNSIPEDDGDREYDDLRTTTLAEAKQFGFVRWHRWCLVNNYLRDQK